MTFPVRGLKISACVSPPQPSVSHMVEVAPSIAQAASTALPPFWNMSAPAVAASGLPVMAIHWRPCRTGLAVRAAPVPGAVSNRSAAPQSHLPPLIAPLASVAESCAADVRHVDPVVDARLPD